MWSWPLTQFPPHSHLSPRLTFYCGWFGAGGFPQHLLSCSVILIKCMVCQNQAEFLLLPQELTEPFSLWYSKECCLRCFFLFFFIVWPDTILLSRDPLVGKWRKSISFPQRGTKVSQVWQLLFYQRSFEWIKMRRTRNWVKILYLRAALGYFKSDRGALTWGTWLSLHRLSLLLLYWIKK